MATSSSAPSFAFDSASFPPLSSSRPPPIPPASSDEVRAEVNPGVSKNPAAQATADKQSTGIRSGSNDCRSAVKPDFASLFRSLPRNAGQYKPLHFDINKDGSLPDLVKEAGLKYWNNILIGFFLDGTLSFSIVVSFLKSRWKLIGDFTVRSDGFHFYIQFSNDIDRDKILRSDPIFIRDRMFILTQWDPTIGNPQKLIKRVPVWIQFSNIPLILWTLVGINWLACHVGRLICFDYSTEKMQRFSYAKALVEINPEAELPDSIVLTCLSDRPTVNLSYFWKPSICVSCNCFGHRTVDCISGEKIEEPNEVQNEDTGEENHGYRFRKGENLANNKNRGFTKVISKRKLVWQRKNVANSNSEENNLNNAMADEILNMNEAADSVNANMDVNDMINSDKVNSDNGGKFVGKSNGKSDGSKTDKAKEGNFGNVSNSKSAKDSENMVRNSDDIADFGLNSLFSEAEMRKSASKSAVTSSKSSKSTDGNVSSAQTKSPYSHLQPPPHIILPPAAVSGAGLTFPVIDPAILSSAVPKSSLPSSKSKSIKLKGKFWDDIDEGKEYTPEEVYPFSSNLKSSRRHTRSNPMYDPSIS